jgi:hypothetical protein
MADEFACLQFCKSEADCNWFTFFPSTSYCELLKTCTTLDPEICTDCLTGQPECVPDDPTCWVEGECEGIVDYITGSPSAEDCLDLCSKTLGCRWFTFHGKALECLLLKTCPTIDESCQDCISGERRCIEDVSTTTDVTSTATTTTTTEKPKGNFQNFRFIDFEVMN